MTSTLPPVGVPILGAVQVTDPRLAALIDPDAPLLRLGTGSIWAEGPVWLPRENALQFSDIPNDRALRWSEAAGLVEVRRPNGFTNGNTLDREGRMVHCEHGQRRLTRTEPDGTRTTLVTHHAGGRLNSPNDVIVKRDGTIWFTDPPYGIIFAHEGEGVVPSEQAGCFVYRFDPDTGDLSVVSDAASHPNGLAFSPDESRLYIADTFAAIEKDAPRRLIATDVIDGRTTANPRTIYVLTPEEGMFDGFRVDVEGNIWTSTHLGIRVLTPDGTELGRVNVPEITSNCVFGGADGRRLFITASSSLYAIDVRVLGAGVGAAVGRGETHRMTSGTVGFLGLGAMGAPMARVLLSKGWTVVSAPRDPAKHADLAAAGVQLVADPAAVAPLTDTVILCLPDAASVREVLLGANGLLSSGAWAGTVVDCSTIAPAAAQDIGRELAARGVSFLDAPISGGVRGATNGTLSIMVGGEPAVLERVRPVLGAMGTRVTHCGALGAGQVTKACNQLIVMSTTTAVAESMRLAEHAGVDPWIVREVLLGGYANSPLLDINGPRIIDDQYAPGGKAIFHAKDIETIEEMSQRFGLPLPLFEAVRGQFERLFAAGGGDLDHSAVGTLYPHAPGFPRRG